jgi:hypothetical protein
MRGVGAGAAEAGWLFAEAAGFGCSGGKLAWVGVTDFFQAKTVRRDYPNRGIADHGHQDGRRPGGRAAALTDREQGADERPDHVVAERIGHNAADGHAFVISLPVQPAQCSHGSRSLPAPAERREVMLTEQPGRGRVHGGEVEAARVPQRVVPAQRVGAGWLVADPVGVTPPQRGKPRVEPGWGRRHPAHPDVWRQRSGQPPQRGAGGGRPGDLGQVRMRHLAACVHSRVGAPGDGEPQLFAEPQHPLQSLREHAFYSAAARLRSPSGKACPVVGKINFYPNGQCILPRFALHASASEASGR